MLKSEESLFTKLQTKLIISRSVKYIKDKSQVWIAEGVVIIWKLEWSV